ncbi:unnamed protein product [Symbiodinium sp. KB8]|nr:unnamed protein product [Symbiodinium sp. KB8]
MRNPHSVKAGCAFRGKRSPKRAVWAWTWPITGVVFRPDQLHIPAHRKPLRSEFSHPDVTIGFTILAYRFTGLRGPPEAGDLRELLKALLDEMKIESTARGQAVEEQMRAVYDVVWESPLALEYLFNHSTFLPGAGIIDVNPSQYMACGQELAGHQLFGLCFGFSGTPNDLLPQAMGKCAYAEGDDGKILDTLSRPEVVTVQEVDAWSPHSLLDFIAKAISSDGRPKYHALIDTGALITGMTNREVATYLLQNGLKGLEGVVFLNSLDERMVLLRDGKEVSLSQCGLGWENRFSFYDHVHTTGMDIKQPIKCTACNSEPDNRLQTTLSFRSFRPASR